MEIKENKNKKIVKNLKPDFYCCFLQEENKFGGGKRRKQKANQVKRKNKSKMNFIIIQFTQKNLHLAFKLLLKY